MSALLNGFLTTVFILLYLYLTSNYNYWKEGRVPNKKPNFLFGDVFQSIHKNDHVSKNDVIIDTIIELAEEDKSGKNNTFFFF